MQLDIGVTSGMQLGQILEFTRLARESNLNHVWLGDDIAQPHDVFTVASVMLLRFPRISLGIGITSPLIRNISTIARASVTLTEIGESTSFRLGLGVGGLRDLADMRITLRNPASVLGNAVMLLKKIWKGETVSSSGEGLALERYGTRHTLSNQIPLFLGVRGPKLLKLAGEIADGVIVSGPKTYVKKAISLVKESIGRSKRPRRDFKIVIWNPTILTEKQDDLNLVRRTVAFVLGDTPGKVVEMAELNHDKIERIKAANQHRGIYKAAELVTDDLLEEVAIHGNSEQISDEYRSLGKMGAQEVVFGPPYGADPPRAVRELANTWSDSS